ncbi:MAG: acyl-CoA dehydrogenase family protein [bacterium]
MTDMDFDREDLFSFEDSFHGLIAGYGPAMVRQARKTFYEERAFLREHLAPLVLSEDREHARDPDHISWEMLRLAGRHGRLSSFIPGFMGGSGTSITGGAMMINMEEQASVDGAYCGMMGGHALGLVALMMTFNMGALKKVIDRIVARENDETPYVIDCAITEPTAGTDVEEVDLYPHAKLICRAERVPGGAVLNGRKVFISTGHMASDHVVILPFDIKDPVKTMGCMLVPNEAKGFSLGRKERKMGQRAGPASELILEDCFIPEENIVMASDEWPELEDQFKGLLHGVLGITRIAVGAWSTGTARAALERALCLTRQEKHKGKTLINQQWVQSILTNMYMNVMMARSVYLEAQFALMTNMGSRGLITRMPALMNTRPVSAILGRVFESNGIKKMYQSDRMRKAMVKRFLSMPENNDARIQYMSSLAKVTGSDMAMENCHLAVELLGRAGIRHDHGVEKVFRDAKLLQIFEGTNQLNRLNIFQHYFGRKIPGVEVFS